MRFGEVAVAKAKGAVLAHSVAGLKKGRTLTTDDIAQLSAKGIAQVMCAILDKGDVPEDVAAAAIAKAICGAGAAAQAAFTGRANLHAVAAGVARIDEALVARANRVHEAITIATLRNNTRVAERQMLATVKIIPYAVPQAALNKVLRVLKTRKLVKVAAFRPMRAGLVITQTAASKPQLIAKSEEAIRRRLLSLGSTLADVLVVPHDAAKVAEAVRSLKKKGRSPILLFGASAIVDRADVVPQAVKRAGGRIVHLGMPVDPGNLLMLGVVGTAPVVGVPTCANSPKPNGFDIVLNLLCAGIKLKREDVVALGTGGLLAEISSRPQPREGEAASPLKPRVAAVVLAAGKSSRMGANKLLADLNGQPLLTQTLSRLKKAGLDDIVVVTGHMAGEVGAVAQANGVRVAHNPHFDLGLATSLRAGLMAVAKADAALICLGDMPLIEPQDIQRQIAAFSPADGREIIVPTRGRKAGNPVLWGRSHFAALMALEGDRGARGLIEALRDEVTEIEVTHDGIFMDADTPEALAKLRES